MADTGKPAEIDHANWKTGMCMTLARVQDMGRIAEGVLGGLRRADAGDTQIRLWERGLGMVSEALTQAALILAEHGMSGDQVAEAIRAAGGEAEVYGEKRANRTA